MTQVYGNIRCCHLQSICNPFAIHVHMFIIHQHTSTCINVHQHTSMNISIHQHTSTRINIHHHTSTHINIHQHTSTYINIHKHTSTHIITHQHTSRYIITHQHTSRYINTHQRTSTYIKYTSTYIKYTHDRCSSTVRSVGLFRSALALRTANFHGTSRRCDHTRSLHPPQAPFRYNISIKVQ